MNIRKKTIKTNHGELKTPFFMPDATRGFVKFMGNDDLLGASVDPMVVNTYHLYLQPGMEVIKSAGGIHKFMNYNKPLLSDSGGYQVFSLIHKNPKMGKITDNEVVFRSPMDGSKHVMTPEKSIQIQFDLGVDMMVCFDDPPPNTYSKKRIDGAVDRTIAWAERCIVEYNKQLKERNIPEENRPLIFCVIQGGEYIDLRKKCADGLIAVGKRIGRNWDGYGFGARHVDENGKFLKEILEKTASFIPENSLRFALGVGNPEDIVRCIKMGWDMFDCVIPTREGRHGKLFVKNSKIENIISKFKIKNKGGSFYGVMHIGNKKYKNDFSPVDKNCGCTSCKNHSRAYLNHLFKSKDPLGMRLASIHNLHFYAELMREIREEIK